MTMCAFCQQLLFDSDAHETAMAESNLDLLVEISPAPS